jgi:hypothetical protein
MRASRIFAGFLASAALTAVASAQGSDSCTTAQAIAGQGSFAYDQTLATTGVEGQLEIICYAFGSSSIDNDVWYSWTADATGTALINTCASTNDTKIAVYPAGGCPTVGSSLACNDDSCGLQSSVSLPVTAGTAYTLQVGTFPGSAGGTGTVDISISGPSSNDDCNTPSVIAGQGSFAFNNVAATTGLEGQTEFLCYFFGGSTIDSDVWYTWTADATGNAVISTCAGTVDTKIAVYPGAGCPTAGSALACNDDACGLQTQLSLPVTTGTTYTLQVGTFPGAVGGSGNVDITIASPLTNDDCATPTAIAGQGSFAFNQFGSTTGLEGQAETLCYFFGSPAIDNDVWFTWTADATGSAVIGTCTSGLDTKIALYPGSGCPTVGSAIACNDDSCALQSTIVTSVVAGTTYTLQVGSFPGAAAGTGNMDISITTPVTSDDCATPDAISGQGSFAYDSTIATTGAEGQAEFLCYSFGTSAVNKDVWFSWTANATGQTTVSTCNSTIDTKIAAYPGTGCPTTGSALACNDDTCGLQSEITFAAVAGTTYTLQIGQFSAAAAGGPSTFDIVTAGPAEPGTAFCFCDGGNSPCGNGGTAGNGCANGADANGANLTGSGSAVVGADSLVLSASGLTPNQPGLYFQGLNAVNGGAGVVFGDGIRCAGGGVIRLGVRVASATGTSDTSGLAQAISVKGAVAPGDLRHYQLWYRDPAGSPCGALFNLSNGYTIQW